MVISVCMFLHDLVRQMWMLMDLLSTSGRTNPSLLVYE